MTTSTGESAAEIDRDLEPGETVGEYKVDGKLGHGAFGTVFKATHPLIGKVVAIKVLARRFSVDPEMVSRFIAEARAVNQIRNRHIIDIFSFGSLDDGRQYYVMEYLDGEPLDALIDRVGNLSLADSLPILRGIAKAIDAAHGKGIAHRDLKAENVFLANEPDSGGVFPKLLDFGIAKLLAPDDGLKHKTRTGAPIGTPYYMSPEQCRGKDVDHRTDHYAFGVLAYRMLTGVYPFDGDDYMTILMKQINDEPEPPSAHLPDLPAAIDDAVLWLLAKDPAQRPPDLRSAVGALEQAAEQAGIEVGRTSWDGTSTRAHTPVPPRRTEARAPAAPAPTAAAMTQLPTMAPKKSKAPIVIVVVALVAAAAGAAVYVTQQGKEPDQVAKSPTPAAPAPVPTPLPPGPPAPAPLPEPPVPPMIIVTVNGAPPGTEVSIVDKVVGAAPGPLQLPLGTEPVVLTFRADGYLATSVSVVPDADKPLDVKLAKKKAAPRPGGGGGTKPTRDDILDPFGKGK